MLTSNICAVREEPELSEAVSPVRWLTLHERSVELAETCERSCFMRSFDAALDHEMIIVYVTVVDVSFDLF